MKITTYKYKKVPVKDTEIFIPKEPFYCFQTGIRRAIRVIPIFITWDCPEKGDLYQLVITCVYQSFECIVEKFTLNVRDIEIHINTEGKSKEAGISRMFLEEDYHIRTEKQFNYDLNTALNSFTSQDI